MSVSSGFFNSVNGDRTYDEEQFASLFDGVIIDGVFDSYGNGLKVTPGAGLSVIIGSGKAWFNHTWTINDAPITIDLPVASSAGSRYDAVVLKVDTSDAVRENTITIISGNPASSPTKPAFVNTTTVHHYPLAYVLVGQSASSISSNNIEDARGTDACPFAVFVGAGANIDILPIRKGGTGNKYGYIQAGQVDGVVIGDYDYFTAEGLDNEVSGYCGHGEGMRNKVTGSGAHAEGSENQATGRNAHAEGEGTKATADFNGHAEGAYSQALGESSHAANRYTIANYCQTVVGSHNESKGNLTDYAYQSGYFIVGCGSSSYRANCFRATESYTYGKSYQTSGADYAEMFEWKDENPNDEDRIGLFVTLDGDKIRLATSADDYILGIISALPALVGDEGDEWHSMYKTDIFGRLSYTKTKVDAVIDKETGEVIVPEHYDDCLEINPDYDPDEPYIHRKDRPEWDLVGLMGKIVCIDDGTADVNEYVYPGVGGVATKAASRTKYRVMQRLDSTHIRVMIL